MPLYGGVGEIEVVNEVQLAPTSVFRDGAVEADGDLTVRVHSFFYDIAGLHGKFNGVLNLPVSDNDDNFVYLDSSATLQITTSGYPVGTHIRLARVIAQSGIIVRVIHERSFLAAAQGGLFPPFEDYEDNPATIDTPNSAFVEALKMTTSSLPAGTYLISWSFEVLNSSKNGKTRTRVQLDDSDDLASADKSPQGGTEHVSGEVRRALVGVHTIDIDFFPLTGASGEVRRRQLNIRRVA